MDNLNCLKGIRSYQSATLTDEESIKSFIVRKKEFERIMAELRRDDMTGSIQHYLLVGQRGSGKSSMLRRIQAEVNQDKSLSERLIVVNLSEEQAGIYRIHDMWDMVLRDFKAKDISVEDIDWTNYDDDLTEYSKALYKSIQNSLKEQNKKLLLLLDNIDRIFDNIKEDSNYLRELLINHKDLRIIGGSTRMNEHYWKYDMPFYQFFRIIKLESLTKSEVEELLLYWADCLKLPEIRNFISKNPGKLETIRTLTDGMPRTLLNFLEILIDSPHQNGFEYLKQIIDSATPLYQERLNRLPPAQRKVVIELANFWDATKVKPLIAACKMTGKTISAQLNNLVKNEIVEKIATSSKDNLYRLKERFFNLWLLMTQGGIKEKQQAKYLTLFLENWYGIDEKIVFSTKKVNSNFQVKDAREKYNSPGKNLNNEVEYVDSLLQSGSMEKFDLAFPALLEKLINNNSISEITTLFIKCMVHKQYNFIWHYFNDAKVGEDLKEMIKPIYYVTAELVSNKESKNESLKPGPELRESIDEIKKLIKNKQKLYYSNR